jgi:hypothetical protein
MYNGQERRKKPRNVYHPSSRDNVSEDNVVSVVIVIIIALVIFFVR